MNAKGFTIAEAARTIGVSRDHIERLAREKKLTARTDKRGVLRFTRASVDSEARKRQNAAHDRNGDGRLASEVFRLLSEGKSLAQCVIDARATPEQIEKLHAQFVRMSGIETTAAPCARCARAHARFCGGCVDDAGVERRVLVHRDGRTEQ